MDHVNLTCELCEQMNQSVPELEKLTTKLQKKNNFEQGNRCDT